MATARQHALAQQIQLFQMVAEIFPDEETREDIRTRFDRVKNMTESELMMDSRMSEH